MNEIPIEEAMRVTPIYEQCSHYIAASCHCLLTLRVLLFFPHYSLFLPWVRVS